MPVQNINIWPNKALSTPFRSRMRFHRNVATRLEAKQIQSTKSRSILVLLTDGLFQNLNLDMASFLRELACRYPLASERMQGIDRPTAKLLDPPRPVEAGRSPTVLM